MRYLLLVAPLAILLVSWLGWRLISGRRSLPCPSWLGWLVDNPFLAARSRSTVELLELAPGMQVLDAGCGPGRLTIPIAAAVGSAGRVVAVDVQPEMLRRARAKAEEASVFNIDFVHAGLGEGKLPQNWFDRAVLETVLGEIPDRLSALREIRGSLKPGGFLLVREVLLDPHFQSVDTVRRLGTQAAFIVGPRLGAGFAYSIRLTNPQDG